MTQWYLNYDNQQVGPLDEAQAAAQARQHPEGYAWREGFIRQKLEGSGMVLSHTAGTMVERRLAQGKTVWIRAAPQRGGRREEGSVLGSLDGLLDGDNR